MNAQLSIIICTYNRAEILEECLKAICNQTLTQDYYKILVVDNNSNDATYETVNSFVTTYSNIRYVLESKQGLSYARNKGTSESDTEWVAFLDDDGLAHSDFVEQALFTIEKYKFDCFGGKYYAWYKYGKPDWLPDNFGTKIDLRSDPGQISTPHLDGGILFVKKNLLSQYGGFPTNLGMTGNKIAYGEEALIQHRLLANGYVLGYNPNIKMEHLVAKYKLSMMWHLKQKFATGRDQAILKITSNNLNTLKTIILISIKNRYYLKRYITKRNYPFKRFIIDFFSPIFYFLGEKKATKILRTSK